MKRINFFAMICLLALSACSFKKNGTEERKAAEPTVDVVEQIKTERAKEASNGQLSEKNVEFSFKEAEMGSYEMTISWPSDVPKVLLVVNDRKEIVSGTNSYQTKVPHSKSIAIEMTSMDSFGSPVSVYSTILSAPVDIIISSPRYLKDEMQFRANRMYLLADGSIVTNGHHLSISVNKLYVEEAKNRGSSLFLQSAKISTQGAQNFGSEPFEFRNSSITVTAKKAVGTLSVALIGFNGRNGRSGSEIEVQKGVSRQRDSQLDGVNGADEKTLRTPKTPDSPAETVCVQAASNGQDGKSGAPGANGDDGQNGGDTGNLLVTVDDNTEFSLEVGTLVGLPGKGGLGAPGHEGGNGGAPGKASGICSQRPQAGKEGAQGAHGANGKDGIRGRVGTISSNVAKQKVVDLRVIPHF